MKKHIINIVPQNLPFIDGGLKISPVKDMGSYTPFGFIHYMLKIPLNPPLKKACVVVPLIPRIIYSIGFVTLPPFVKEGWGGFMPMTSRHHSARGLRHQAGFTLIELMVVVVIVAIFAAIAIPSYARYMERKDLAVVKQEAQKLATELERFKAKNYSYRGFNATYVYGSNYDAITGELLLPVGSTATTAKYTLTLLDADDKKPLSGTDIAADEDAGTPASHVDVKGLKWIIIATRMDTTKQAHNYDLLLNSDGLRCMTKTTDIIKTETVYSSCSDVANSEAW